MSETNRLSVRLSDAVKSPKMRARTTGWIWAVMRTIMLLGFSYIILYPLFLMLTRSVMDARDLYDNSIVWLPKHFSTSTVRVVLLALNYGKTLFNSIWVSGLVTVLQALSCMMAGYGFARLKFPLKRILFAGVILSLIVPPQLITISSYLNFKDFDIFGIIKLITGTPINLLNTPLPIFLLAATASGIKNGLFIYIFRQFFKNMPVETEEAALVDGAGGIQTFISIMMPGALNAIITVVLFSFVWQWNDTFFSSLYLGSVKTLSTSYRGLNLTGNLAVVDPALLNYNFFDYVIQATFKGTAVLLILAPLIIMFLLLQRYFVDSVERSGIVG